MRKSFVVRSNEGTVSGEAGTRSKKRRMAEAVRRFFVPWGAETNGPGAQLLSSTAKHCQRR